MAAKLIPCRLFSAADRVNPKIENNENSQKENHYKGKAFPSASSKESATLSTGDAP